MDAVIIVQHPAVDRVLVNVVGVADHVLVDAADVQAVVFHNAKEHVKARVQTPAKMNPLLVFRR